MINTTFLQRYIRKNLRLFLVVFIIAILVVVLGYFIAIVWDYQVGVKVAGRFEVVYQQQDLSIEVIRDNETGNHYLVKDRAIAKMSRETMVEMGELEGMAYSDLQKSMATLNSISSVPLKDVYLRKMLGLDTAYHDRGNISRFMARRARGETK